MTAKTLDITGNVFGRLTVLSKIKPGWWLCKCSCGKTKEVALGQLRRGRTRSCGCLIADTVRQNRTLRLAGSSFGRLTVLALCSYRINSRTTWECKCSCGKYILATTVTLRSGDTSSCGCFRKEVTGNRVRTHGKSKTVDYIKLKSHKRRAIEQATRAEIITVYALNKHMTELGNKCFYCNGKYEHIDHFLALARGGTHTLDNLVPSCAHCNLTKSDKIFGSEWLPSLKGKVSYSQIDLLGII